MLGVLAANGETSPVDAFIASSIATLETVADSETDTDLALAAYALTLPSENVLCEAVKAEGVAVDPTAVHAAREQLKHAVASASVEALQQAYRAHRTDFARPFELTTEAVGARQLCSLVLQLLCTTDAADATAAICAEQLRAATNMTDELAALTCLVNMDCEQRQPAIDAFESKWSTDELVMQSWFSVQALCPIEGTLGRIKELMSHPMWTSSNTNFVRALVGAYQNNYQFHAPDGSGYEFFGDFIVEADGEQDRMAAGLTTAFSTWRRLDDHRQQLIEGQLRRIMERPGVSAQVYEVASKILEQPSLGVRAMAMAEALGIEA